MCGVKMCLGGRAGKGEESEGGRGGSMRTWSSRYMKKKRNETRGPSLAV